MITKVLKYWLLAFLVLGASSAVTAQDDDFEEDIDEPVEEKPYSNFYWGFKGGLTLATQKWNTFQRQVMPTYHGAFLIEYFGKWSKGRNETGPSRRLGMLATLGYAQRGATYRTWNIIGTNKRPKDVFHNIGLLVAAKGLFRAAPQFNAFYGMGLRAEYTVRANLVTNYSQYVNNFNYGVWFAGGIEFALRSAAFFVELSFSPDVSKQVRVPMGVYMGVDQITGQNIYTNREEKIYNLSFEVSVGVKFGRNEIIEKQ